MKPGISRATVAGFLGFGAGAFIVTTLRAAFGFEPTWNLGLVLVLGVFMSAYTVIWGMGGFNPQMSEHPDDSKVEPTVDELAEQAGWRGMLSSVSWQVGAISIVLTFLFIAVAVVPGFGLNITDIPEASSKGFGTTEITLFGDTFPVNQAFLLVGFILFTVLSLAIAGAALMGLTLFLDRGAEMARNTEPPAPGTPRENAPAFMRRAGDFAGTLADRIAPPDDKDTTAVVAKEEN